METDKSSGSNKLAYDANRSNIGDCWFRKAVQNVPRVSNRRSIRLRQTPLGQGVGTWGTAGRTEIAIGRIVQKVGGEIGKVGRTENVGR